MRQIRKGLLRRQILCWSLLSNVFLRYRRFCAVHQNLTRI